MSNNKKLTECSQAELLEMIVELRETRKIEERMREEDWGHTVNFSDSRKVSIEDILTFCKPDIYAYSANSTPSG